MRPCLCIARCLIVFGIATLGVAPATAEQGAVEEILTKASALESARNQFTEARRLYESLLVEDGPHTLTPTQRAKALVGAARCWKKEGKLARAVPYWELIAGDSKLPADAREYAQRELDDFRRENPAPAVSDAELERRRAAQAAENRRRAARLVEAAKRARDRGDFEAALAKVFEALASDAAYMPALEERSRILAERPDRATMLESVLRFVQTQELNEHQHLTRTVRRLRQQGKTAAEADDFDAADRLLRDAILRLDDSGFLETSGPLFQMRQELVTWLERIHERAADAGKRYPSIPDAPALSERTAGLQAQFFSWLAKWLRPRDGRESLRFYRFNARRRGGRLPLLSSRFESGVLVAQTRSRRSRAEWAERRIRTAIGSRWTNPLDVAEPAGRRVADEPRVLARFGDVLAVQHREDVLRRVEALRGAFSDDPPGLNVDIHLFAAGAGGTVRATQTLGLRATGAHRGLTLVHRDALVEQCAEQLEGVEGLLPLGSVHVELRETSSTELMITQLTENHPMFAKIGPPPLVVPTDRAAFGLWLDLFAEDMTHAPAGLPRCAVSLVARTRMPTHTTIVPRNAAKDMPFSRIPQLGEHRRTVDLELPHFGTCLVMGLPNPFVPSNGMAPELLVLMGVRRADDRTPDPSNASDERVVPDPYRQREHDLGPLATEVLDHAIDEAWPDLASAALLPRADRVLERDTVLATMLAQMARMGAEDGDALSVAQGRCVATLTPEQHVRLARAARDLRRHEARLYQVEAVWREMPAADWIRWQQTAGVSPAESGAIRMGADTPTPLDDIQDEGRLFVGRASTLARATQRVALRRLQERTIVRDVRAIQAPSGTTRLLPESDLIHQGLVFEVRPGLEREGVRAVYVRARSARWERVDSRPHPLHPQTAIDVPFWHRAVDQPRADRSISEIVGDNDVLLIELPVPGDVRKRLIVKLRLRVVP